MPFEPTRRGVMVGGTAGALLAAFGYRAFDRGVFSVGAGPAFEPWRQWRGKPGEGILRPLHAAILSANAHNSQPWLFSAAVDTVSLYADRRRHLGSVDPFRREMYISLGCALTNLHVAAAHFGYGGDVHMARGRLEPSVADGGRCRPRVGEFVRCRCDTPHRPRPLRARPSHPTRGRKRVVRSLWRGRADRGHRR